MIQKLREFPGSRPGRRLRARAGRKPLEPVDEHRKEVEGKVVVEVLGHGLNHAGLREHVRALPKAHREEYLENCRVLLQEREPDVHVDA